MTAKVRSKRLAFVGHSFAEADASIVIAAKRTIRTTGYSITTGEAAEASRISKKITRRIDASHLFVALLTRRHEIGDGSWTTSPWVIEEKAYSFGNSILRPIVLLVEHGIAIPDETGGLHGDLEYIAFERDRFDLARLKMREMILNLPKK
jgi:hypothetical protein